MLVMNRRRGSRTAHFEQRLNHGGAVTNTIGPAHHRLNQCSWTPRPLTATCGASSGAELNSARTPGSNPHWDRTFLRFAYSSRPDVRIVGQFQFAIL